MEKASIPVEVEKEIVTELEQIFRIVDDKPYFELKYKKAGENYYHVGYSSFDFHNVLKWKGILVEDDDSCDKHREANKEVR